VADGRRPLPGPIGEWLAVLPGLNTSGTLVRAMRRESPRRAKLAQAVARRLEDCAALPDTPKAALEQVWDLLVVDSDEHRPQLAATEDDMTADDLVALTLEASTEGMRPGNCLRVGAVRFLDGRGLLGRRRPGARRVRAAARGPASCGPDTDTPWCPWRSRRTPLRGMLACDDHDTPRS